MHAQRAAGVFLSPSPSLRAPGGVDALDRRYADRWVLEQMPIVDRNLLRIGIFELLHRLDVPPAVAINEAVELAKLLSTEDSSRS
jgi:transcription antitermination protein NusB